MGNNDIQTYANKKRKARMNRNELRIGNYFKKIDRGRKVHIPIEPVLKVITIGFSFIDAIPYDRIPGQTFVWDKVHVSDIAPVPLTKEWLLKLGFEFWENEEYWVKHGFPCISFNKRIWLIGDHKIEINYVHELQNLYFVLMNKELA